MCLPFVDVCHSNLHAAVLYFTPLQFDGPLDGLEIGMGEGGSGTLLAVEVTWVRPWVVVGYVLMPWQVESRSVSRWAARQPRTFLSPFPSF